MLNSLLECQCCGSKNFIGLNVRAEVDEWHEGIGLERDPRWALCMNCCFVFQNPRQDREAVEDFYRKAQYRSTSAADVEAYKAFSPQQLARFDSWLLLSGFDLRTVKGGNCLDFGCGIGGAMTFLANQGNVNYGIEIDDTYASIARQTFPISIFSRLSELPQNLRFNFIFTHHAVEHIFDPNEFFSYADRTLADDGFMVLVVPAWRYSNVMGTFNGFGAVDFSMWDHIAMSNFLNKYGFYMPSYLYQNYGPGGDWELVVTAMRSPRKNHFTFSVQEALDELYTNIKSRALGEKEGKPRMESVSAIMGRPAK